MAESDAAASSPAGAADTRESARGWHQIQLAVLGFVGLCGVLQKGRPQNPVWLQTVAGMLVVGALATALVAIVIVGRVAWPPAGSPPHPARQLRTGILLTFVAVAMLALGTASMWWPQHRDAQELVQIETTDGRTWCGSLTPARAGTIEVDTDAGAVAIAVGDVATVRPVDSCG
jgi:hypothetical protein